MDQASRVCGLDGQYQPDIGQNTGRNYRCALGLFRNVEIIEEARTLDGKLITCKEACERQENELRLRDKIFPNRMFPFTRGFWPLVKQLYRSCRRERVRLLSDVI